MKSKLKIGISAKFFSKAPAFYGETNRHIQYIETKIAKWITRNGGLPFLLPTENEEINAEDAQLDAEQFAFEMDALILQGGSDIDPSTYGKSANKLGPYKYDKARDIYELSLIKEFIRQKKPIFGICRGLQLLNVYFEGTLIEDLETSGFLKHFDIAKEEKHSHEVYITEGSFLSKFYKKSEVVSSIHHQGIDKLGHGLSIEAKSTDGLIESFSKIDNEHFIFAVQWHPEFHNSELLMNSQKMFQMFLNAAKNRKFFGHLNISRPRAIPLGKSSSLSLGVELELQIIDKTTSDLSPMAPTILNSIQNQTNKIKNEIFQSMIEVETAICSDANEVESDLKESLKILCKEAEKLNHSIVGLGTHPLAKYSERILTESPRYNYLIESKQWIARRISIFGLHCHVGTKNPDEAIALYRFYLSVAPLLLGISASSPYFQGEFTGLHSVRSTFFESTPAGGHPPIISSWSEFEGILTKMLKSKSVTSHKDLWWDVRPSLNYGTIEIRICDMMPSLKENVCLVALIHFLGHCFLKYKSDYPWPNLSEWSYRENKWRALRYGVNFDFIASEDGGTIQSSEFLKKIIADFSEEIQILGYEEKFKFLIENMLEKNPAQKILDGLASGKNLKEIVLEMSY